MRLFVTFTLLVPVFNPNLCFTEFVDALRFFLLFFSRWVLLKNVHLAPQWLVTLEKKLHTLNPHAAFRLFMTMEINPKVQSKVTILVTPFAIFSGEQVDFTFVKYLKYLRNIYLRLFKRNKNCQRQFWIQVHETFYFRGQMDLSMEKQPIFLG